MCTTSISMMEINRRLDAPNDFYHSASSPSSISDVETTNQDAKRCEVRRSRFFSPALSDDGLTCSIFSNEQACDKATFSSAVCKPTQSSKDVPTPVAAGDDQLRMTDDKGDYVGASPEDINADVTPAITTSPTLRKRKLSDVIGDVDAEASAKRVQAPSEDDMVVAVEVNQDHQQERSCSESFGGSVDDRASDTADDGDGYRSPAYAIGCSTDSPNRYSRRTLYIEYWSRTDECKERKWDHLDEIAEKYGCAEDHIFATTLNGRTACLEPNMFPYDTPAGIEHWTLWHVNELSHEQIKQYVENWIDANAPHVEGWNYDGNPERSIDIFHVHVYLQVSEGMSVLQDRQVEELVHELD